jgi:hypothetical protein
MLKGKGTRREVYLSLERFINFNCSKIRNEMLARQKIISYVELKELNPMV